MSTARPEAACVRGKAGMGQFAGILDVSCFDGVLFSQLPSNDLDAILTPSTTQCRVSPSIHDRYWPIPAAGGGQPVVK